MLKVGEYGSSTKTFNNLRKFDNLQMILLVVLCILA